MDIGNLTSRIIQIIETWTCLDNLGHSFRFLNSVDEKKRNTFFNKLYSKIKALKDLIEATQVLDFE